MIIDSNTHPTTSGIWFNSTIDASLSRLLSEMQVSGIDRSVIVPLPGSMTNDEVRNMVAGCPESCINAYTFNPALYSTSSIAQSEFESSFSGLPRSIVKFHNRFGGYQPDDERFMTILKVNNSLKCPMVVAICGFLHNRNSSKHIDTAGYFFDLALKFPSTQFIIMHGGGCQILRIAEQCRDLQNVYIDLSYTLSRYRNSSVENDIRWLCEHFDKRLLWGSDFPEISVQRAWNDIIDLTSHISIEKRNRITGLNLLGILNE